VLAAGRTGSTGAAARGGADIAPGRRASPILPTAGGSSGPCRSERTSDGRGAAWTPGMAARGAAAAGGCASHGMTASTPRSLSGTGGAAARRRMVMSGRSSAAAAPDRFGSAEMGCASPLTSPVGPSAERS
jgi:hypothetical protein